MRRFKTGVVGLGHFARQFIPLFQKHPVSAGVALCELRQDVLKEQAQENEVEDTYTDFDQMLKSDIDAVAIFTQRWTHAPMAIKALKSGKHVYSAVPAGVSAEELEELVKTVEQTGLTYALGETSYYRPQTIWCREKFAQGAFGRFVYGEGNYYHDMAHWFYRPFYDANGPEWKRWASVPPMWYISHSASHVLSITMSRFTKVSCLGWQDHHEDGIFDRSISAFDNDFSNQSALFGTADGGMARINEFRRSAGSGANRQCIVGTLGAYDEHVNPETSEQTVEEQIKGTNEGRKGIPRCRAVWMENRFSQDPHKEDESFDFVNAQHWSEKYKEDVSWIHLPQPDGVEITEDNLGGLPREYIGKRYALTNAMLPVQRLPEEYIGLPSAHGSGQLLVHDFMEAMSTDKLPPNHVWIAARYSIGGAIAHESSRRGGEQLSVPDFGLPPADAVCIDPLVSLKE